MFFNVSLSSCQKYYLNVSSMSFLPTFVVPLSFLMTPEFRTPVLILGFQLISSACIIVSLIYCLAIIDQCNLIDHKKKKNSCVIRACIRLLWLELFAGFKCSFPVIFFQLLTSVLYLHSDFKSDYGILRFGKCIELLVGMVFLSVKWK